MLSLLVSHRYHCLPSRAFNASPKRNLQISRPRRALRVFSVAAAPSRKRTPAPRRSLRVVATVILEVLGAVGLAIAAVAVLFAKGSLDSKYATIAARGNQFMEQAQYAGFLVAWFALSMMVAYLGLSLIDWGWSCYKSKEEKRKAEEKETRLQQLYEESMSDFCQRLSLADDNKQEQVAILKRKWTVANLYELCLTRGTFESFYASLGKDELHDATIVTIWNTLQKALNKL